MKNKKMPKKPAQSASLATWERYAEKVKEVEKHNAQVEADKKKKAKAISYARKLKSSKRLKTKLPKQSSSLQTWENVLGKLKEESKAKSKKEAIQKKYR